MSTSRQRLAQALRSRGCRAQIREHAEDAADDHEFVIDAGTGAICIIDPIIGCHLIEEQDADAVISHILAEQDLPADPGLLADEMGRLLEAVCG